MSVPRVSITITPAGKLLITVTRGRLDVDVIEDVIRLHDGDSIQFTMRAEAIYLTEMDYETSP